MSLYFHFSLTSHYHTSNSRECMGVSGEALQLHAVYKIHTVKLRESPYQVLQVACAASEHAMKTKVHMMKSVAIGIVTRAVHS